MFKITSITVATTTVPGPQVYWVRAWGEQISLEVQVLLVQGDGLNMLINTGPPEDLGPLNDRVARRLGPNGLFHAADRPLLDSLAALGMGPTDITHVVCTPFQTYTTGKLLAFPNAQILLSRCGWLAFHQQHEHPHSDRTMTFGAEVLAGLVTWAWPQVRLLDDEEMIAPGLSIWSAGGHHKSSVVVEIDTKQGVVAASDCFFRSNNVTDNMPIGMFENLDEILVAYDRLRRSNATLASVYDPETARRFR